jgi:nicotinamide mononucleotide (NMN) deamidase PncC
MILNALNADKIDFTKVKSIEVFSTYPTCQSCTAGLMALELKVPAGEFTVFEGGRLP